MRRATIVSVRTMIVLLLVAAAVDLKLPGRSRDRIRIHLVDRSASVGVPGPVESLLPRDADDIIAPDVATKARGDVVTWASFGRTIAFESRTVDGTATDLAGALRTALGRNPTEIVLYTDGRGAPGDALFLCRERGVPVHVFPLGPTSVKDVRIVRVEAPPDSPPGVPVPLGVVVESTYPVKARVQAGAESREVDLAPHIPARLAFTLPGPGEFRIDLDVKDACEENNHLKGVILERIDRRRLLLLSSQAFEVPGYAVTQARSLATPDLFDVIVLDDVALPGDQQEALARYAERGGGILLLGDPRTHVLGLWKGTPIERISPFQARPDLRVAVVLGIDASGSMDQDGKWDTAVDAVTRARRSFDADDTVVAMTFGETVRIPVGWDELRKVQPAGGTKITRGILEARLFLEGRPAGRRHIFLMTDGEVSEAETPEERRAEASRLQDIGLTVVTTNKIVDVGRNVRIRDWKALEEELSTLLGGLKDLERETPGIIEYRDHPATRGAPREALARILRTSAKADAQIAATVGQAPSQDPVLAFRQADAGRVGAFAIRYDARLERLFRQAIDYVAGDGDPNLTLSIDPPMVRARGKFPEARFETTITKVEMSQVSSDAWEGRLPDGLSGTVVVRKGRARAAATIPCPPELEKLGVDRASLERIARETGGRVLTSPAELAALPRPENPAPRSGRPDFLIAALVLVFIEMAVSTFWKV